MNYTKKVEDRILISSCEEPEELSPPCTDRFRRRYPNTDDFQRSAISGLSLEWMCCISTAIPSVEPKGGLVLSLDCRNRIDIEKMIAVGGISQITLCYADVV